MNIDNVEKHIPDIDKVTNSANKFIISITLLTVVLALLSIFVPGMVITSIRHSVALVQAVLVCSTALMGLSGLIVVDIRKTTVPVASPEDGFDRLNAMNRILSLVKANVFLRWSLSISFFAVLFSGLYLIYDNQVFIIISLAASFDQLCFFVFGLLFADLLPS